MSQSNGSSAVDITASSGIDLISWAITPLDLINTVHDGILITIHLERPRLNLHKPLRFKTKDVDWENWKNVCEEKGKQLPQLPDTLTEEVIDHHVNLMTSEIIELAKTHLGCQKFSDKSRPWFNDNVRTAMAHHRAAKSRFQKRQTPHNKDLYMKSKSELQNAIKQAKCDLENHQINEINKAKSSQEM